MEPESVSKNLPKGDTVLHASGNLNSKSKTAKADKNMEKYIDESKNYQICKYFREGLYLDCKDDFNWCVATIKAIDADKSMVFVHFDNWSSKYDEELKFNSKKIYPLRFYSEKYTGQKKSTLREYDVGLTKKEGIIKRMEGYAQTHFSWTSQEEIQEMYQFLCGESYLYLDSWMTCDEKDAKNDAAAIVEVVTAFFEMLAVWLRTIPPLFEYLPYMSKYPYLYLVCPEAAILNLHKSFIPTLELIFGYSPRSEEFLRTSSSILNSAGSIPQPKTKRLHLVQAYFMESFINTKCIKELTNLLKEVQANKSCDFSVPLSLLSAIAPTFTKVESIHEEAVEFTQAVNSFLFEEGAGINSRIRTLPPAQVKELNENEILSVIRNYYELSGDSMGKELYCAKTQLDLFLILLQSPYIDKKITALNEIKRLFDKKNRNKDVPAKTLAKWLSECNIIEYIYKEAKHPELISRSADLILILSSNSRLEAETLELLWET